MRTSLLLTGLLLSTPAAFSQTTTFCTAEANSTGVPAHITTTGSLDVVQNAFGLRTISLPADTFGIYLVNDQAFSGFTPPGSDGNLCLANPAGGANPGLFSGSILPTGPTGIAEMPVDLTGLPLGGGVAVAPGDTFNFQLWFRDEVSAGVTSNFSDAVAVTFDPPAVSFATDIWDGIFRQPGALGSTLQCVTCHAGMSPASGLDLSVSAADAYSNLVNVSSAGAWPSNCASVRVVPFSAAGSLLVQVMEGTCTNINPNVPVMTPPDGQLDIDTIRAWIDAGAPNN